MHRTRLMEIPQEIDSDDFGRNCTNDSFEHVPTSGHRRESSPPTTSSSRCIGSPIVSHISRKNVGNTVENEIYKEERTERCPRTHIHRPGPFVPTPCIHLLPWWNIHRDESKQRVGTDALHLRMSSSDSPSELSFPFRPGSLHRPYIEYFRR
jgi:hypothetical protein